jgi:phage gp36-like protein
MPYATQADLETRFGSAELAQLTDRISGSVIDAAVVGRALADAEAEIDGYLAARYQLPLASAPAVLGRITCDIARYYIYDDRVIEAVKERYKDAVRLLKSMASGEVMLDAAVVPAPAASSMSVSHSAPARIFNADSLAGY